MYIILEKASYLAADVHVAFLLKQGGLDPQPYLVSIPLETLYNVSCAVMHANAQLVVSANLKEVHNILLSICTDPQQRYGK